MMRPPSDCDGCPLHSGRTNIVLPSGDIRSKVVLVGEAPGENEDMVGRPFVGRAGKILDAAMADVGLERSRVMITNTVKCRPPGNRDPTKEEMSACRPYLEDELHGRRMIVGLGRSACRDLMGYEGKMSDIANKRFSICISGEDVTFVPTYHPAACIYNKEARIGLREALAMVKEVLDDGN